MVAKLDEAVALLAEARQLMALLIGVLTKLFLGGQKIFEVELWSRAASKR